MHLFAILALVFSLSLHERDSFATPQVNLGSKQEKQGDIFKATFEKWKLLKSQGKSGEALRALLELNQLMVDASKNQPINPTLLMTRFLVGMELKEYGSIAKSLEWMKFLFEDYSKAKWANAFVEKANV